MPTPKKNVPLSELHSGAFQEVSPEREAIAREALGIPEGARVSPMDVSKLALFVAVQHNGEATANATIPKRDASYFLRQIADRWDMEWKAEERAEQQRIKHERVAHERRMDDVHASTIAARESNRDD